MWTSPIIRKRPVKIHITYNEWMVGSSPDSCVSQRVMTKTWKTEIKGNSKYLIITLWHRDTRTPGHRTDNMQILILPGCEQPLRDNYIMYYILQWKDHNLATIFIVLPREPWMHYSLRWMAPSSSSSKQYQIFLLWPCTDLKFKKFPPRNPKIIEPYP